MNIKTIAPFCIALIAMTGCGDDDNPVTVNDPSAEPLYFAIYASPTGGVESTTIRLDFSMELSDEIPVVTANGKTIEGFYFEGASVNGYLNLPMSERIDFSVSSGEKSLAGSIAMPTRVDEVSCNGIVLQEDVGNLVAPSGTYLFEWSGGNADFFVCHLEVINGDPGGSSFVDETMTNDWTAEVAAGDLATFEVAAVNGSGRGPGASPYITSDWAKGYVNTTAFRNRYWFFSNVNQMDLASGLSAKAILATQIQVK